MANCYFTRPGRICFQIRSSHMSSHGEKHAKKVWLLGRSKCSNFSVDHEIPLLFSWYFLWLFHYDCLTGSLWLLFIYLYKVDFQPCQLVSAAPWTALVEASLAASPHSSWNHREHVGRQHLNMQKTTRHLEYPNHGTNMKKSWSGNFLHSEDVSKSSQLGLTGNLFPYRIAQGHRNLSWCSFWGP